MSSEQGVLANDPAMQLAPKEGEGPSFQLLKTAFEQTVRDSQPYVDQCRLNYETRYALWNGQTADGKKHSREGKAVEPTPWDGASDLQVFLTDSVINKKIAMKCMALRKANLVAAPINSGDVVRSGEVSSFMRWLIKTQVPELGREEELLANYLEEKGVAATGQFWETHQEKTLVTITIDQLQQKFPTINVPELLASGQADDDLMSMFIEHFDCSKGKARSMLNELKRAGETTVPALGPVRSYPVIRAFNLDQDLFISPWATDIERSPGIYRIQYFTAEQLRSFVHSDGWDEAWVEKAIETCRGKIVTISPNEYLQPIARNFTYIQQRYSDNIGVVYAYQRLSDEDGVPGIYLTIFNPTLAPDQNQPGYAKYGLLGYAHGQYPFVLHRREYLSRKLHDSRGIPEPGKPWQQQIKAHKDSRIDAASWAVLPPLLGPQGRLPTRWGPGVRLGERRPGEYHFADKPQYDPITEESERLLMEGFKEYMGFASREGDPAFSVVENQFEVDKFLSDWARAYRQLWKLYQQYGSDEVYYRVIGIKNASMQSFKKGDPNEDFDFYITYDIQSTDFEKMAQKWQAIIQAAQTLDRDGQVNWGALLTAFVNSVDPNIAETIIQPADVGTQKVVDDEHSDLAQIYAGISKNIKIGTPPQLGLQIMSQYVQGPDVQQKMAQDQLFKERIEARAKQYQQQLVQQQNAITGRLGASMPDPQNATPVPR